MKHPAFSEEEEWRLHDGGIIYKGHFTQEPDVQFRSTGERLVPYLTRAFAGTGFVGNEILKEVLLGQASSVSEDAAALLLHAHGFRATVRRSDVPVR
jgi:hypothetical protein